MQNKYQVKLLKWTELQTLQENINKTIEEMEEKWYNLKDIKQFNYDRYIGYTFIIIFYKLN